jgi:chromosomal replication initiator protein
VNTERATQVWNDTTVLLSRDSEYNHSSLNALFSSLLPVDISEDELVLSTTNLYTKDWVERRLTNAIHDAIWSVSGRRYGFRIIVVDNSLAQPQTTHSRLEADELISNETFGAASNGIYGEKPFINASHQASPGGLSYDSLKYDGGPQQPFQQEPLTNSYQPSTNGQQLHQAVISTSGYTLTQPVLADNAVLSKPYNNLSKNVDLRSTKVDQSKTFESFVVGEANQLAFSMAFHVAKAPGYIMNPLFIYGKSGLGKTHLLLSIKHYVQENNPGLKVVYIQTNELISEYSNSARMGDFSEFNRKYYSADVFLLDDVQSLEKRIETTNTVFEIFNRLKNDDKQVVLSADRAPNEIDLHERYLSRFNSGVIADVQPPSFETKLTIFANYLDYCCRRFNREDVRQLISPEVVEYIVSLSSTNIRELEGAATNLVWNLISNYSNRYSSVTIEEAEQIVGNHFRRLITKDINVVTIIKEVEGFYNVNHEDIIGAKRSQEISYPRQVAMYLCRFLTNDSLPSIARSFRKDHTAVMYAYNNIDKKRQLSSKVDREIKGLIDTITS